MTKILQYLFFMQCSICPRGLKKGFLKYHRYQLMKSDRTSSLTKLLGIASNVTQYFDFNGKPKPTPTPSPPTPMFFSITFFIITLNGNQP